jgi:hypothetical protein
MLTLLTIERMFYIISSSKSRWLELPGELADSVQQQKQVAYAASVLRLAYCSLSDVMRRTIAMAVTSRQLRSVSRTRSYQPATMPNHLHVAAYGVTLLFAALALYAVMGMVMSKVQVLIDDIRYGRPRTTQLTEFVGHGETTGLPTHLMAINLNRQVVVVELPGGDPSQVRTLPGPYLFGADEHLTPVFLSLKDIDGDGSADLLLDVRREQIVYLNKDGAFRLPTPEEDAQIRQGSP